LRRVVTVHAYPSSTRARDLSVQLIDWWKTIFVDNDPAIEVVVARVNHGGLFPRGWKGQ